MDQIVLALFRDPLQIEAAFQELRNMGFSQDQLKSFAVIGNLRGGYQIATIGTNPEDRYADMKSELFKSLRSWGVPKDEAFLFTAEVRRGGKLAIAFSRNADVPLAVRVFENHGALNLEARKEFAKEKSQSEDIQDGLSLSPFTHIAQETRYEDEFANWFRARRDQFTFHNNIKVFALQSASEDLQLERNLNE